MVKTWQVVLATIAIFVAGLVTGGATALGVVKWAASRPRANASILAPLGVRPGAGPTVFAPQLMKNFSGKLDLTGEQRAKIEPIVRRTAAQLGRERRDVQLTSALAIEKMQDEIAPLLSAPQRAKFEEIVSEQRARLQQFRQRQPPPGQDGAQPPQAEPLK